MNATMDIRRTRDIPGLISCGVFVLLVVGCGALAVWGYLSGPEGHPSNAVIAIFLISYATTFISPAGAVIGIAGLAIWYRKNRTLSAVPSLVGSAANSVIFTCGASFYFLSSTRLAGLA